MEKPSSVDPNGAVEPVATDADAQGLREQLEAAQRRNRALEEQVRLLSDAQQLAGMGSWELELETGRLTLSEEIRSLFKIEPEVQPDLDEALLAMHPEDRPAALAVLKGPLGQGETGSARVRLRTMEGDIRWMRLLARASSEGESKGRRYGIIQDVQELVNIERGLADIQERWKLAIDASEDGVWDWNLLNDDVVYSERWGTMLGYDPSEIERGFGAFARLVHPDDLAPTKVAINDYLEGRTPQYRAEFRIKAKDGSWRCVFSRGKAVFDANGKPTRMLGTHTDITERKKQEEAFKRLSLVASKTTTGVVITDAKGKLTWVNKAFERMSGYFMEEVLGKSPGSFLQGAATDPDTDKRMRQGIRMGQGFHVEVLNYRKSGVPFWVEVEATPVHDAQGKLTNFIAISTDITTRRLDRERIEESERRFRDISNAAGEYIWEHDINGHFTYVSDRVRDVLGITPGEFIGLRPESITHPDDHELVRENIAHTIRERNTFVNIELRAIHKNGDIIWLNVNGVPKYDREGNFVGYRGAAMDITQRKHAEEQLSTLYQRFQLATNSAQIGVWEYDFSEDKLVWDSIMYEIFRLPADRFCGSMEAWTRVILTDDYPEFESTMKVAIERGGNYRLNFRILWPDEEIRHITGNLLVMLDDQRQPVRIIGTNWDITEQKQAERQALEARDLAEEANRAKSAFLAMMSHEIRTPMNGVVGMIQALRETSLDEEQRDFLSIIESSSGSLMTIINDILDYSKAEAGRMTLDPHPIDIERIVGEALTLYSTHAAEKKLELVQRVDESVPPAVLGDETRIRQVLVNLISNAVKFTDRGRVTIKVSSTPLAGDAVQLHFSVSDTGIGIKSDQMEKLFEPFVQADASISRRHGGTGLGLAISRRLVELMSGRIWCESTRLLGTVFHFTINVARADPASLPGVGQDKALSAVTYPGRILLAEDNPINRKVVQFILDRLNCKVDHANDGQEALAMNESQPYDLILMDVQMPGVDGLTATVELRQRTGDAQRPWIIGLSAAAMKEDVDAAKTVGMNDFLTKPLKPQELEAAIRRAPNPMSAQGAED